MIVLLDAGPLGLVTNRNVKNEEAIQCQNWVKQLLRRDFVSVCVAEIADYEVRRELIRSCRTTGIERLNEFESINRISYAPITTEVIRKAAELWAWARQTGQQTARDESLDADVILAATAIIMGLQGESVVIATTNVSDLERYTPAKHWRDITF